jgi:hypothetical protein
VLDAENAKVDVSLVRRVNELRGYLGGLADVMENDKNDATANAGRRLKMAYRKIAPTAKIVGASSAWAVNMGVSALAIASGMS